MSKREHFMFINKAGDGRNNISGKEIARRRKAAGLSQRALAEQMQLAGLDLDKNAVQRIESGQRFVTDIELLSFAAYFHTSMEELAGATDREGTVSQERG